MRKTIAGEDRLGHVREQAGEEQHDEQDDERHGHVGELGAALLLVEDLRLGRAAVDDEGAGEAGGDVGPAEPDDVAVHVDARSPCFIAKLREVAALWAMISTKQENAIAEHLGDVAPGDARGQADRREAALHGADHRHPCAGRVGQRRDDDRAGRPRRWRPGPRAGTA